MWRAFLQLHSGAVSKVAGGDFCSVVSTVPKCKRGPTHKRWIFIATQLWIAEINNLHITSEGPFAHLLKFPSGETGDGPPT